MEEDDIRQYSAADINEINQCGEYEPTPQDAPAFAVDQSFWESARLVDAKSRETISMQIDADVLDWFKAQGEDHLRRMHNVLRSYVEARKLPLPPRQGDL